MYSNTYIFEESAEMYYLSHSSHLMYFKDRYQLLMSNNVKRDIG